MELLSGPWVNWLRNFLIVLAVALSVYVVIESSQNRAAEAQVEANRTQLAKEQAFANIDSAMVQLLARTAAEKNDTALQTLLAQNGVTIQVTRSGQAAPAAAAASSAAGSRAR